MAFVWERNPQGQEHQQEALLWERGLVQAHHRQLHGGSAFAEEPDVNMGTPTFNLDDLRKIIQEQELAEQTESEGRRVPKEEGVLEVDAKISLERERILEQESLIQKMNANPWFLYEQGITRLRWPSGAYVVSEYGDGRVKTTSWVEVPDKLRRSLLDIGPETWICHPFSGFSVYFFLKARELGKWQGNLLMEMEKERVYTRLDNLGNPVTGYTSGFGDIPDLLYTNQSLIDAEFRDEDFIIFPKPTPKDRRAKKPSPKDMSDQEYAAAWEDYRAYRRELDIYREFEYIRKDFQFVVSCFSELYGEELFNYLRVNQDNHELRKRFVLTLEDGDCVFDCSLREPFNSRLIIAKIKKRWDELEMSSRNFSSRFGRKAFNDLAEYDFVKAKHADRLQDLLDRPYEDILVEEIIDSLPSRTVVEEMEVEDQPAPSPARPSEAKQDIKEEDEPMEVDESSAAKKPRVSSKTDAPMEGSSVEEVSSGQPGSSSRKPKVEGTPMGEGSTRRPKPSTRQPKVEGSSVEEESTPPPPMEPTTEEAEEKVRQGVWGDTTTTLLPDAFGCWRRTPWLTLLRVGWILSQQTKSLWTRRGNLMSPSPLGRAANSWTTENKSSTRNPAHLSGSSASKSMEVHMVDSITIIAAMTPSPPSSSGTCATGRRAGIFPLSILAKNTGPRRGKSSRPWLAWIRCT